MGASRYPRRTKLPNNRPSQSLTDPSTPQPPFEQPLGVQHPAANQAFHVNIIMSFAESTFPNIATAGAGMGTFPALQQPQPSQSFPTPSQPTSFPQASVWQPASVYARVEEYLSSSIVVDTSIAPLHLVNIPANPYLIPPNNSPVTRASTPAETSSGSSAAPPSTGRRYSCRRGCDKTFTSPKDVSRHYKSRVHTQPKHLKQFICRCGYATPRKDHHRRHLDKTACMFSLKYFSCVCPHPPHHLDRVAHLNHINGCQAGRGQQGRPPRMMPRRSLD